MPFETWVENVLASEWIPSWGPDSLAAGAMAARPYAWYFVKNWPRQGTYNGACYNVDDSTNYQRYVPGVTFDSTITAALATWNTIMANGGQIVEPATRPQHRRSPWLGTLQLPRGDERPG